MTNEVKKQPIPTKEECLAFYKELAKLADVRFMPYYNMAIKALEQEPCENCISREKAKQSLYERIDRLNNDELYDIFSRIIDDMYNELPSVTPQPKMGQWIYDKTIENWRCSECNETPKTMGYVGTADFMAEHFRFCNHCCAKMEVGE